MSYHERYGDEAPQVLRIGMVQAAERRNPLPARFTARCVKGKPCMVIRDDKTEKEVTVPLFAYGEVRKVLFKLFG